MRRIRVRGIRIVGTKRDCRTIVRVESFFPPSFPVLFGQKEEYLDDPDDKEGEMDEDLHEGRCVFRVTRHHS